MKKLVSMLLVLSMVLALAGTAMAAPNFLKGDMVEFKCDSNAYNAARESKKSKDVVQKGSYARFVKTCGDFSKLIVNDTTGTTRWFKTCDLKYAPASIILTHVVWAKGGKGMSKKVYGAVIYLPKIKCLYVKVSGHTNLRKTPSLHLKSQGVVEKCTMLKLTGNVGYDDRAVAWYEVSYNGKKLWVSENFLVKSYGGGPKFYDKDCKRVYPF